MCLIGGIRFGTRKDRRLNWALRSSTPNVFSAKRWKYFIFFKETRPLTFLSLKTRLALSYYYCEHIVMVVKGLLKYFISDL